MWLKFCNMINNYNFMIIIYTLIMNEKDKERRLKVNSKAFQRQYNRYILFPEIKLCGKWLQDLGFESGNYVIVECQDNEIRIRLEGDIDDIFKD